MPDLTTTLHQGVLSAPFTDLGNDIEEVFMSSPPTDNTNAQKRRSKTTLVVKDMTPNQDNESVGYKLRMILEERVNENPDIWAPIVETEEWDNGFKNVHILEIRPGNVQDEGTHLVISTQDGQTLIMRRDGVTPGIFRIRILKRRDDPTQADLTSIDCTISLTLFDNTAAS